MPGLPLRCRAGAEVGAIREKGVLESSACSRPREAWESTRLKTGLTVLIENRPSRRFKPCPRHQNILTTEKLKRQIQYSIIDTACQQYRSTRSPYYYL